MEIFDNIPVRLYGDIWAILNNTFKYYNNYKNYYVTSDWYVVE